LGGNPVESPFLGIGQILTFLYFLFVIGLTLNEIILLPLAPYIDFIICFVKDIIIKVIINVGKVINFTIRFVKDIIIYVGKVYYTVVYDFCTFFNIKFVKMDSFYIETLWQDIFRF